MSSLYTYKIKDLKNKELELLNEISAKVGGSNNGLTPPSMWDLNSDKRKLQQYPPLQIATISKIVEIDGSEKYIAYIKNGGKYIVDRAKSFKEKIEENMRVGLDRSKMTIIAILPQKIDSSVAMMQVEDRPNITYADIGGLDETIHQIRECVEEPLLNPEKYINLGIDPPKGVLLYGPPGTGKTLIARAIANRTSASFIKVSGSELVHKYIGEGARLVREIFKLARSKNSILFFDEVDAFGSTRFNNESVGEVQRTMLEVLNQLDGFDYNNCKIIFATNKIDLLDPALIRPGRIDRKIEFKLPNAKERESILNIHIKKMNAKVRVKLLAQISGGASGAELAVLCKEAGMYAIRERRSYVEEKDFIKAVEKVIYKGKRFSMAEYLTYN